MIRFIMTSELSYQQNDAITVLSTLPDNPGDSRFWTVSPSLQIRV